MAVDSGCVGARETSGKGGRAPWHIHPVVTAALVLGLQSLSGIVSGFVPTTRLARGEMVLSMAQGTLLATLLHPISIADGFVACDMFPVIHDPEHSRHDT